MADDGFWTGTITQVIAAAAPGRIAEIGTESGGHTAALLRYCRETGAHLDLADIRADARLETLLADHPHAWNFHPFTALQALTLLPCCDAAVLDTDPNWYTVYHVLQLLFARAVDAGRAPPLVFLHGAAWPYARRDAYRDPGMIPERHAYAQRGIAPGKAELDDSGAYGTRFNALSENGPMNGVLTAAEDFVASWPVPIAMHVLPYMGGLAILVPQDRLTAGIASVLDELFSAPSLLQLCARLDEARMRVEADLAARGLALDRCAHALGRARTRIASLAAEAKKTGGNEPFPPDPPSIF